MYLLRQRFPLGEVLIPTRGEVRRESYLCYPCQLCAKFTERRILYGLDVFMKSGFDLPLLDIIKQGREFNDLLIRAGARLPASGLEVKNKQVPKARCICTCTAASSLSARSGAWHDSDGHGFEQLESITKSNEEMM